MSGGVYKKIEVTGTSPGSVEEAVNVAVAKASQTVKNLRWFEVTEIRGTINDNKVSEWQVTVKIGFRIND